MEIIGKKNVYNGLSLFGNYLGGVFIPNARIAPLLAGLFLEDPNNLLLHRRAAPDTSTIIARTLQKMQKREDGLQAVHCVLS
jgi:hypothetical protein